MLRVSRTLLPMHPVEGDLINLRMPSQLKVSVIVPIYNGERFVESCCNQLAIQTLSEIEIILVDDGSTDGTGALCDEMQARYPNVRAVHQQNAGVSAARNCGVRLARGKYVAFVDVDDEYEPDMLEFEYDMAVSTGADVACLDSVSPNPDETVLLKGPERALECLLGKRIKMSCCNKLFKKELVATEPFPNGIRIHEDFAALYSILGSIETVACRNAEKYHYIHREGSSSKADVFIEKYFDGVNVIDGIVKDVEMRWPKLSEIAIARQAMVYLRISKIYWLRGAPLDFRERINAMKMYLENVPKRLVRKWFTRNDMIRLSLYLHCFPLFLLLVKTIDRN